MLHEKSACMNLNESATQTIWCIIAQRTSDIAQRLFKAMLVFCKSKRKGRKRMAVMSLVRRVQCNLTTISILARLSYKKDSLYLKFPVGLLLRSCLMDTIYALYFHDMKAKEAEEELEVLNKDYVKSLGGRFDVYKDKVSDIGLSEEEMKGFYDSECEDTFIQYLTYEMDGEKLKTKAVKSKDLRTLHGSWPENLTIANMVEYVNTKPKQVDIVNRLNAYYKYFSQYEHFSEQGCGDSVASFGDDNVSFPSAIDALEEGLKVVVRI